MKKTLFYLLVLVTLLLAIFYLFFDDNSSKEEQERDFAIENFEEVSKIIIKDRNAKEVVLSREEGEWVLNDKYEVKSTMLSELIKTVTTMELVSVVSVNARENVLKEMISRSSKVSFYKKGKQKPFKVYIVGGPNHEQDGTHVLMEIDGKAASTPYVAKVPGRRGFFTYHFTPNEEEWRSLQFTKLLPQEIKEVSIEYLEDDLKAQSFRITREKGNFSMTANELSFSNEAINQFKAQSLFNSFSDLHYESYQDKLAHKDSIMTNYPFANLSITDLNDEQEKLQIYRMPLRTSDRKKIIDGEVNKYNIETLYAFHPERDIFATIQIYTFKDILLQLDELKK